MSSNNFYTVIKRNGKYGAYHTWAEDDSAPSDSPTVEFDSLEEIIEWSNSLVYPDAPEYGLVFHPSVYRNASY